MPVPLLPPRARARALGPPALGAVRLAPRQGEPGWPAVLCRHPDPGLWQSSAPPHPSLGLLTQPKGRKPTAETRLCQDPMELVPGVKFLADGL